MAMSAKEAFACRDASQTIEFQNELLRRGASGQLAYGLFRAQKRSSRAKDYRHRLKQQSYAAKEQAMVYTDRVLTDYSRFLGVHWGWQRDEKQAFHDWVLYVQLSHGQCSFHADRRMSDREFKGEWDQSKTSEQVVTDYCKFVMTLSPMRGLFPSDAMPFGKHSGESIRSLEDRYIAYMLDWDGIQQWPAVKLALDTESTSRARCHDRVAGR